MHSIVAGSLSFLTSLVTSQKFNFIFSNCNFFTEIKLWLICRFSIDLMQSIYETR